MSEDYDVLCLGRQFAEEAAARTIPTRGDDMRRIHEQRAREYVQLEYDVRAWRVKNAYGHDAESLFRAGIEDHLPVAVSGTPVHRYRST